MAVNIDDFDRAGTIDWTAYRKAQEAAGEICQTCHKYMWSRMGYRAQCSDCRDLGADAGEVRHSTRIRCPKCRLSFSVQDAELFQCYEEGEHDDDEPAN